MLPPPNPFLLTSSIQPIIHFDSAQSDAISVENWSGHHVVEPGQVDYLPAPVAIPGCVHRPYADGTEAMIVTTNCSVTKLRIDGGRFEVIDELIVPGFEATHPSADEVRALVSSMDAAWLDEDVLLAALKDYLVAHGVSVATAPFGLYTLVDRDGFVYAGYETTLFKFGDQGDATVTSPLRLVGSIDVRAALDPRDREGVSRFLGVNMTYDGEIIIALPGVIAAVDRALTQVHAVPIPGEAVDNGVSVDDGGGIYIVTSAYMRKFVWTGTALSAEESDGAWKEPYDYLPDKPGMWLSRGSGATPTLMGFGDNDELVVIPDAGDPVKLVAYWRNEIPADATLVEGAPSRRVAAQVPLGFDIRTTVEWSPHVYGDGVMAMASDFPDPAVDGDYSLFTTLTTMGYTRPGPVGAHKLHWDGTARRLVTDWIFTERAITWTLSPVCAPNNAVYLNTLEGGDWRIIGLDWNTGERVAEIVLGSSYRFNCAGGFIWPLPSGDLFVGGMFGPVLIRRS
jgi:hypothetical protein